MKKSRPVFYPEFESDVVMVASEAKTWEAIRPNSKLRIGRPSNRYYQYIHTSLNFKNHSLHNFRDLLAVEGMEVTVRSILKMRNGEHYAVLISPQKNSFGGEIQHLYAEIKKAFTAKEIIEL